jgi:hypothetical protein
VGTSRERDSLMNKLLDKILVSMICLPSDFIALSNEQWMDGLMAYIVRGRGYTMYSVVQYHVVYRACRATQGPSRFTGSETVQNIHVCVPNVN